MNKYLKASLVILVLLFLSNKFIKGTEKFVNWNELSGFNNRWGDNDRANVGSKFQPKKVSGLITGCDEKRGKCITY